jgi:hypothetical protein
MLVEASAQDRVGTITNKAMMTRNAFVFMFMGSLHDAV